VGKREDDAGGSGNLPRRMAVKAAHAGREWLDCREHAARVEVIVSVGSASGARGEGGQRHMCEHGKRVRASRETRVGLRRVERCVHPRRASIILRNGRRRHLGYTKPSGRARREGRGKAAHTCTCINELLQTCMRGDSVPGRCGQASR
jgi:hypothetical protein